MHTSAKFKGRATSQVSFDQGIFLRPTPFPIRGAWFEKKRDVAQPESQTNRGWLWSPLLCGVARGREGGTAGNAISP